MWRVGRKRDGFLSALEQSLLLLGLCQLTLQLIHTLLEALIIEA